MMIEVKEQYVKLLFADFGEKVKADLLSALESNSLNNVLILVSNETKEIDDFASFLEKELETTNGLACFVGEKEFMNAPILKDKVHVIALPTEHEGIEAIMMNILENEFLKGE